MKRWFLSFLTFAVLLGNPETASADVAGLVPCKDSAVFKKRLDGSVTKLNSRLANYDEGTPAYLALQEQIERTQNRFDKYGKQGLLCGADGLPHLILGAPLEPWGALLNRGHEGDLLIPGTIFIYIAGIIGWSGREYLIESKKTKNPADMEIFIDFALAQKCLIKGSQWPLLANKQGRSGELRESDKNITLNGPR